MGDSLIQIRHWLKRGIAILLFLTLLVGASATAFYALAAGISALSGVVNRGVSYSAATFSSQPASTTTTPTTTGNGQTLTVQSDSNGSGPSATPAPATSPVVINEVDAAVGQGGFALGNQVENVFGSMLSGVLNTLFLDRPTSNPSGGTSGQTQ